MSSGRASKEIDEKRIIVDRLGWIVQQHKELRKNCVVWEIRQLETQQLSWREIQSVTATK